jgi:hypothetical protein
MMKCVVHLARIGDMGEVYKFSAGKFDASAQFGRYGFSWEDNKIHLKEV